MNPPRDIPGYYYGEMAFRQSMISEVTNNSLPDKEKKKYFKVLPSGAGPATSAYSSRDVKKRRYDDAIAEAARVDLIRQKDRIRRSSYLEDPLFASTILREFGEPRLDVSQISAANLVQQGEVEINGSQGVAPSLFTAIPRPDLGPSIVDFFIASTSEDVTRRLNTDYHNRQTKHGSEATCFTTPFSYDPVRVSVSHAHGDGAITSMCANASSQLYATTWLSSRPGRGIRIAHTLGYQDGQPQLPDFLVGPGAERGEVDIFSSIAAPSHSNNLLFAFGTNKGIMVTDTNLDTAFINPRTDPQASDKNAIKDVFALEFLSNNHPIILSGGRSGILNITDLRLPQNGQEANRILHPTTITNIKQIDSHRLLMAGLDSKMCQYDLRFRRLITQGHQSDKSKTKAIRNVRPTSPIVEYADYQSQAVIGVGLDIDVEMGLIATWQGSDSGNDCMQLFSLHGGNKLKSRIGLRCNESNSHGIIKSVQFVREDSAKMKSLWFMGSKLYRFTWAPEEDEWYRRDGQG
ncbi:hypothetical protein B0O99DRAFT_688872 [Bisporella sp. PMI_857]|nr:hypothetical protein B0O99DRAFT_688872 [Bisporella sp. PMI_857]